jgi:hypothetical protein
MTDAFSRSPLVEFSCVSRAADRLPSAAILRMAQRAWSQNARQGITGSLRFENGAFHQIVEGTSDVLLPLVSRILTDPRHEAISIRSFRPIERRRYDVWTVEGLDAPGDLPVHDPNQDMAPATVPEPFPATANVASIRVAR